MWCAVSWEGGGGERRSSIVLFLLSSRPGVEKERLLLIFGRESDQGSRAVEVATLGNVGF